MLGPCHGMADHRHAPLMGGAKPSRLCEGPEMLHDVQACMGASEQDAWPAGSTSFFGDVLKSARANTPPVITGLASCPEGLVSACLDGTIRFHPLL